MNACRENALLLPLAPEEFIDDSERQRLDAHLADCAGCRAARDLYKGLRAATALAATRHAAPPGLSARISAAMQADTLAPAPAASREHGSVPIGARSWLLFAGGWFVSGTLACAVAVLIFLGRVTPPHSPAALPLALAGPVDALIDNHARALITNHVMDVASSDRHTVKPWFRGRVDYSPTVIDLADKGYPLVGARLEYVQNRNLAVLVYQRRQHVIDVYVWPQAVQGENGQESSLADYAGARGFHAVQGSEAGADFVAVSDLDPAELHAFATALASAAAR